MTDPNYEAVLLTPYAKAAGAITTFRAETEREERRAKWLMRAEMAGVSVGLFVAGMIAGAMFL